MYMSDIFSGIINLRERTQCTLDIQNLKRNNLRGYFQCHGLSRFSSSCFHCFCPGTYVTRKESQWNFWINFAASQANSPKLDTSLLGPGGSES